jgi:hypothetical protein
MVGSTNGSWTPRPRLSFLTCPSLSTSSSLRYVRRTFSAPTKNRSPHSSISATVSHASEQRPRPRSRLENAHDWSCPAFGHPPLNGLSRLPCPSPLVHSTIEATMSERWPQFRGAQNNGLYWRPGQHAAGRVCGVIHSNNVVPA